MSVKIFGANYCRLQIEIYLLNCLTLFVSQYDLSIIGMVTNIDYKSTCIFIFFIKMFILRVFINASIPYIVFDYKGRSRCQCTVDVDEDMR